ncbi:hypothetical protein Tco_0251600, partial [Tanacetum coccineum]
MRSIIIVTSLKTEFLTTSQTPQEIQSLVIPFGVEKHFHDIEVAHLDNDFFSVPIPEPNSEESSSRVVIPTNGNTKGFNASLGNFFEVKHAQSEEVQELLNKLLQDVRNINEELEEFINTPSWNRPAFYYDDDDDDDDEEYTIAITPVLPTVEPEHSLSMADKHLSTIPETEESSVEDLDPIPSESEGILDNMCDVPLRDNSPPLDISKDQFKDFSNSNDDSTSIDDDSFSIDDIDYVEASPPDYEPVSLEVVGIVIPEVGGIDTDILLTIKDDILCEKLLNVNLLIAKIKALKDNPTLSSDFVTKSSSTSLNFFLEETDISYNSLPEF